MHIYSMFMHNERQNNVILYIFLSFYLVIYKIYCNFAAVKRIKIQHMKAKNSRLETLKMLISSQELSSQDQLLEALHKEGFKITQATLSRDLKLLKVAKAASSSGKRGHRGSGHGHPDPGRSCHPLPDCHRPDRRAHRSAAGAKDHQI